MHEKEATSVAPEMKVSTSAIAYLSSRVAMMGQMPAVAMFSLRERSVAAMFITSFQKAMETEGTVPRTKDKEENSEGVDPRTKEDTRKGQAK